jgi:hypothetical protein
MENNPVPVLIRKALPSDLGDLLHVARTAFLQAFTAGNKPENITAYLKEAFTLDQFGQEMANPASTFFVAEQEGEMLGYLKVNQAPAQTDLQDPESLEIARLYVLEAIGYGNRFCEAEWEEISLAGSMGK